MPERARAALELMHVAVARHGGAGQPPWPVTLSSVPGRRSEERAHLRDHTRRQRGRLGAVVRPSPEESGTERWSAVIFRLPLFGPASVDPAAHPACPAPQVYWETWAGFLGTRAYCWSPVCSGRAHRPDPQRLLASDLGPGPRPCRAWRRCTSASPWTWALHLGTSCILQARSGKQSAWTTCRGRSLLHSCFRVRAGPAGHRGRRGRAVARGAALARPVRYCCGRPGPMVLLAVPGAARGGCRRAGPTGLGPLSLP